MTALPMRAAFAALAAFAAIPAAAASAQQTTVAPATAHAAQSSSAGGVVRATHGAWQIQCGTPEGAPSEQCALIQNVIADFRPDIGLSVQFLKTPDYGDDKAILRVLAPAGVLLPKGVQVYIEGKLFGVLYFARCVPPEGCYAEVVLEKAVLDTLRSGATPVLVIYQTPEDNIGFPIDLTGFAEGLKDLPVNAVSFDIDTGKSATAAASGAPPAKQAKPQ